jgi:hypothetical protein
MKYWIFMVGFICISKSLLASFDQHHSKWNELLKLHVHFTSAQTYVDYQALKANDKGLKSYLDELESLLPADFDKFNSDQKLSFWINAYNAYTVQIILDNYPVKSIKDIKSSFFSSGPWKKKFIKLLGKELSLDDIEHAIIRKEFKEPRIHFAVNCASISCPNLLAEAFRADLLELQLEKATLAFLKDSKKNKIEEKRFLISKIFKWYGDDFKEYYGSVENFILIKLALPIKKYKVDYMDYDWALNDKKQIKL